MKLILLLSTDFKNTRHTYNFYFSALFSICNMERVNKKLKLYCRTAVCLNPTSSLGFVKEVYRDKAIRVQTQTHIMF